MVVLLHVNIYGVDLMEIDYSDYSSAFLTSKFMYFTCFIAVNIYVMISGYFLSAGAQPFKIAKLLHLILVTVFWSWLLGMISCLFLGANKNEFILYGIFPILSGRYWFVTLYILMYILSPYLKMVLIRLSKRQHAFLLGVLLIFFSLVDGLWTPVNMDRGFSLYWFLLYMFSAFIRKCEFNISKIKLVSV